MQKKIKVTIVVPESLQRELRQKIINDNYGMRGKSKWVSEAIEQLLANKDYANLVNLGDGMSGFGKVESVILALEVKQKVDEAILEIRKEYPLLEGVQSRIIRTSIVQRLLRY